MSCASFEDWGGSEEARSIHGKVALILTDPPYNSRRAAGAANSEHDRLSLTEMIHVADLVAKLLRPNGQAYIFCSFVQWADWRRALLESGGGGVLAVSENPEIVVRHPSAVHSGGRFAYHRANVVEVAVHAYKRAPAGTAGDGGSGDAIAPSITASAYRQSVGFSNPALRLYSDSTMPVYAAAIDSYVPPRVPELLRVDGSALRPEQKSVRLLRDLIRVFAPNTADIIVDMFAGTMSTVAAALLEGHPVYACELDRRCFDLAEARIHQLQYRRGAAGLIPRLSREQVLVLRGSIPPRDQAPDVPDVEPDSYTEDAPEAMDAS
jgi:predicted RNA methylase